MTAELTMAAAGTDPGAADAGQITPVFIFAVPRSGSTLLQRIVAANEEVATAAEPWILLPFLMAMQERPPLMNAWHRMVGRAIRDFVAELPGGEDEYYAEVGRLANRLYASAAPAGARLFLDKTPPYHNVVDGVLRAFPHGKAIFLWRNPLSVVASTVETFCGGRWQTHQHRGDLFDGIEHLTAALPRYADRVLPVRYEELVGDGERTLRRIADYLDLEFDPAALERFTGVSFSGAMGDPTGTKRYDRLTDASLDRWKQTVCNPLRKAWCRRYLLWIGAERLAVMGYDLDALLAELESVPVGRRMLAADTAELGQSLARELVRSRMGDDGVTRSFAALRTAR